MNILSLFNGCSGAYMALSDLGIKVNKYYVSEIDKFANKAAKLINPDSIFLGDITQWNTWDIDWSEINLIAAGSPCQGFSFAGKQLAFEDPRSKLFFEFIDILNHCRKFNPNILFFLENVIMKKEHMRVINEYTGLKGQRINSNLVSAQNRDRMYWTNISTRTVGLFSEIETYIEPPKDRGILLKDIIESEVDEKYFLSEKALEYLNRAKTERIENVKYCDENDKSSCITANYSRGVQNSGESYIKMSKDGKISPSQDKASCFTAGGNSGGNHSDMDIICVAMRGRDPENPSNRVAGSPTEQRLEAKTDGKTNCVTSVQKDNLLLVKEATYKGYVEIKPGECFDFENPNSKTRRGRKMDNKSNCVMAKNTDFMQYTTDYRLRRLTPLETMKLQTIPERFIKILLESGISDTQLYRQMGNGWTIEVIKEYFSLLQNHTK